MISRAYCQKSTHTHTHQTQRTRVHTKTFTFTNKQNICRKMFRRQRENICRFIFKGLIIWQFQAAMTLLSYNLHCMFMAVGLPSFIKEAEEVQESTGSSASKLRWHDTRVNFQMISPVWELDSFLTTVLQLRSLLWREPREFHNILSLKLCHYISTCPHDLAPFYD